MFLSENSRKKPKSCPFNEQSRSKEVNFLPHAETHMTGERLGNLERLVLHGLTFQLTLVAFVKFSK